MFLYALGALLLSGRCDLGAQWRLESLERVLLGPDPAPVIVLRGLKLGQTLIAIAGFRPGALQA